MPHPPQTEPRPASSALPAADLARVVSRRRALLADCPPERPPLRPPLLPRERARQKLADGVPLLHAEDVDPNAAFCRERFACLLGAARRRPLTAHAATAIDRALSGGRLDFERALGEALAGHPDHVAQLARWASLPADLLGDLLSLAVEPTLRALAAAYHPLLAEPGRWQRPYCPLCGAWPGLVERHLAAGQRHARCLRCGTDWLVSGSACVYCGNDEQPTRRHLPTRADSRLTAEVCDRCRGYLKALDTAQPQPPEQLVRLDLDSVALDIAAVQQGYRRPSGAGFRLEFAEHEPDEALDDLLESD